MMSLALAVLAWAVNGVLLAPIFFAVLIGVRRLSWIPAPWAALAAGSGVAGCALVVFWAYFLSPALGVFLSVALVSGSAGLCWRSLRGSRPQPGGPGRSEVAPVVLLACGAGLFYLGALYLCPAPQAYRAFSDRAANRFISGLPSDNTIPFVLADSVYSGSCSRVLFGDWLTSDRPPLQSGWSLITRPVTDALGLEPALSAGAAGIWMQVLWVAACYGLLRTIGLRPAGGAAAAGALTFTGFFLLNTLYVWPKLGAGALVCGAFCLVLLEPPGDPAVQRRRFALAGLWAGLGWMAHGGVAFALLGLAPWAVSALIRRRAGPWVLAAAVFVLVCLPWSAFQRFYAPPGNRLVKWHLAGQVAVDSRGTWQTIREAYSRVGLRGALGNRLANLKTVVDGAWPDPRHPAADPGRERADEFFFLVRATGLWSAGAAALVAAACLRRGRESLRAVRGVGLWSAATFAAWIALMFEARSALVHQGSYTLPIALLCLAAAGLRLLGKVAFAGVAAAQAAFFAFVWLPPATGFGSPGNPAALAALVLGAAVPAAFILRDLAGWEDPANP